MMVIIIHAKYEISINYHLIDCYGLLPFEYALHGALLNKPR